jgi:hypothetical protein
MTTLTTLAGRVSHYQCSPRQPCRRPRPTEEIEITPQCTLPVSKTNGHGRDVFSWDEDYDSWFERDNAAAANAAAANADAAADALAALLWQQADWDKADLPVEPDHASSPPMRRFIVLCQDWRQRRRRRCHCSSKIYSTRFPLIMLGIGRSEYETMLRRLQWMRWNAQAVHVTAGASWGAAEPTYAIQADDVVFR